jgi:glucose-6-phosphate 1-dehydrogenase
MDHDEYLKRVRSYIKVPTKEIEEQLDQFCQLCSYVSGQYDQDDSFINLNKHLEELEKGRQSKEQNRVFYMALPPSVFTTVSEQLKRNCYPKSGLARIIVSHESSTAFFFNRGKSSANHPAPHVTGREALR